LGLAYSRPKTDLGRFVVACSVDQLNAARQTQEAVVEAAPSLLGADRLRVGAARRDRLRCLPIDFATDETEKLGGGERRRA
jgi:hypothetical protein